MDNSAPTIQDFLSAVGFVAPAGYTVDYFILPTVKDEDLSSTVPPAMGSVLDKEKDSNSGSTTFFAKKDLAACQSDSSGDVVIDAPPDEMARTVPLPKVVINSEAVRYGGAVKPEAPIKQRILSDDPNGDRVILLQESCGVFPRNTLFSFKKRGL